MTQLLISMGGVVAEKRATGRYNHKGAGSDYRWGQDEARGMGDDGSGGYDNSPLTVTLLKSARAEARLVIDQNWPAVDAVAKALLANAPLSK